MDENIQIDLDDSINTFLKIETKSEINVYEYIRKIVEFALKDQGIFADKIYISIRSVNREEIKSINKEYRNIDKETDVLSFPIFEYEELRNILNMSDEKKIKEIELGDIILCLDVVKEHSIEYNTGIIREVLYMVTHGVCHLLGFDHIKEEDKLLMRSLEEKILKNIGVGINGQ